VGKSGTADFNVGVRGQLEYFKFWRKGWRDDLICVTDDFMTRQLNIYYTYPGNGQIVSVKNNASTPAT
jgi:hypothetical protein